MYNVYIIKILISLKNIFYSPYLVISISIFNTL